MFSPVREELKLKERETRRHEKVALAHAEQGIARQREIEQKVAKQRAVEKKGGELQVGATAAGVKSAQASRSKAH